MARSFSLADAARAVSAARAAAAELVTITITAGQHAGQRYISRASGSIEGDIHDELDARALELANQVWHTRAHVCTDDLFAELHTVAEPLLIFGAGHIAVPLANLAYDLGFSVTVLDDRDEFAQSARFQDGVQVQKLDFAKPLAHTRITGHTFVVLLTRAHKYDFDCLQSVLHHTPLPRYIGMIGSKRRVRAAFKALLEGGVAPDLLKHVHAPVGIEIGAETPAEIAVSIAAELIQVRRNATARTKGSEARVLDRMLPGAATQ